KIIGLEALVRWQHKEHGVIYPDHFIPLAEQHGLIGHLTHWVIGKVVQQERQWQEAGIFVTVSVNISAQDITSLTLPEQLAELLADNLLDPTRLILEVTESALMGKLVTSLDILTRLRLKGVGLSIDDFGTGYSSLSQLHRVPFTELKIDRSFVSNMVEDADARAIVKTCIILGHELKMYVVAEGVETKEQFELLKQLKCDMAQGIFFSKAVSAEKITEMFSGLQRE
ncbi:MAG: EAL domain-containing protein, partial [Gammaproteobacteria bacterium]|nr:EAL domain-containing protein [Gammaproteobacteria bacterium]